MKITLIRQRGVPITIGVDRHTFPIKNEEVVEDHYQRAGVQYSSVIELHFYEKCLTLAQWAWQHQLFDEEVDAS